MEGGVGGALKIRLNWVELEPTALVAVMVKVFPICPAPETVDCVGGAETAVMLLRVRLLEVVR